jgi:hypothetical protein
MKVLIGTPVYDEQVLVPYHLSILTMLAHFRRTRPAAQFDSSLTAAALVTHARNVMATRVLQEPSYTHLLFIDADMGFRPELIEKMIAFDEPVVGCVYPKRLYDHARLAEAARIAPDIDTARAIAQPYVGGADDLLAGEDGRPLIRGDFARARRAGTGIMLIRRDALETLRRTFPELWTDDPAGAYRPMGVQGAFQVFEPMQTSTGLLLQRGLRLLPALGGGLRRRDLVLLQRAIRHVGPRALHRQLPARMALDFPRTD